MSGVFQNIDPPPHRPASVYPRLWCEGRTHSLGVERGGGSIEDARHSSLLYICKYFVVDTNNIIQFCKQPTTDNRHSKTTSRNQQQPQAVLNIRHRKTNNKQLPTNTPTTKTNTRQPTVNNQQEEHVQQCQF
jgi:hypothetical protein